MKLQWPKKEIDIVSYDCEISYTNLLYEYFKT